MELPKIFNNMGGWYKMEGLTEFKFDESATPEERLAQVILVGIERQQRAAKEKKILHNELYKFFGLILPVIFLALGFFFIDSEKAQEGLYNLACISAIITFWFWCGRD